MAVVSWRNRRRLRVEIDQCVGLPEFFGTVVILPASERTDRGHKAAVGVRRAKIHTRENRTTQFRAIRRRAEPRRATQEAYSMLKLFIKHHHGHGCCW